MPYTIWSRGRLIGTSRLDYAEAMPGVKAGDFEPSVEGERLMSVIVGDGPGIRALSNLLRDALPNENGTRAPSNQPHENSPETAAHVDSFTEVIRGSTEYADYLSLRNELGSLALHLRDPGGAVVPTEWITVQDTAHLRSLAGEAADWPEGNALEPWETPPARYQLMVMMQGYDWGKEHLVRRAR